MATSQLYNASQTHVERSERGGFLRRVVQVDAGLFCVAGIILMFIAAPTSAFMGFGQATPILIAGFLALLYDGGRFLWSTFGETIDVRLARLSLAGNALWAIVSIPVLVAELLPLSSGGWWTMAVLADLAALFAVLQWYGLRQMNR
ncbi:hypothetical protein KFU94_03375 [Chloroflexi bacterium TSY]|nr:hypothetical protein [Chloroflexi bacterium TSY]